MKTKSHPVEPRRYRASVERLMEQAQAEGLTREQCQIIYDKCLCDIDIENANKSPSRWKKILLYVTIFIAILYIINMLFDGKPMSIFLCQIQEFIYPGLRLLRLLSIPIIKKFPSLTEYYDETCFIQNPFFYISDMDCWPCYNIYRVSEITDADVPFDPQSMPPFIYKTNQKHTAYDDVQTLYLENKNNFDENSPKITINNKETILISKFFDIYNGTGSDTYKWRLNRMLPALTIRRLFPRPGVVPRMGQSTERFVIIDDPGSMTYELPEPECNFVFVIQSKGERLIELKPTRECTDQCTSVTVHLTAPYMLWYNWWYWRPVSRSTKLNTTSVSYLGSYC